MQYVIDIIIIILILSIYDELEKTFENSRSQFICFSIITKKLI